MYLGQPGYTSLQGPPNPAGIYRVAWADILRSATKSNSDRDKSTNFESQNFRSVGVHSP